MAGRPNLPGGGTRKASQRRRKLATPSAPTLIAPAWRPGDRVRWREYLGQVLRTALDGQIEILIGSRTYRVAAGELRAALRL